MSTVGSYTLNTVIYTVLSVQCTVNSEQCTVYSVQCSVYIVQCTVEFSRSHAVSDGKYADMQKVFVGLLY